jgi:hypothetical protein
MLEHEDKQEANMASPRSSSFPPFRQNYAACSHGLMQEIVDKSDDEMREVNLKLQFQYMMTQHLGP